VTAWLSFLCNQSTRNQSNASTTTLRPCNINYYIICITSARQCNTGRPLCSKRVYPLKRLLQNVAWGTESQVRTLMTNFTIVAFKCGSTAPKVAKIGIYWYKFSPKGYTASDFLIQNLAWNRKSQVRTLMPIFTVLALRCGLTAPKIVKMEIFGTNLPIRENSGGPQKNWNIGAQLQTFLYAATA